MYTSVYEGISGHCCRETWSSTLRSFTFTFAFTFTFTGAPERISANDILTSTFASLCKSRVFIMAVDFKGKIEGTAPTDAAQYHSGFLYMCMSICNYMYIYIHVYAAQ